MGDRLPAARPGCANIETMKPPVAVTVAAHDPLGGAGLAADLTTFAAFGVHGAAVVTAVTAQRLGSVDRVVPSAPDLVADQLDGIIADLAPTAAKSGLVGDAGVIEVMVDRVRSGELPAPVVDPVMVDGTGRRIVPDEVLAAYIDLLLPAARVVTPNLAEATLLVGRPLATVDEVVAAGPDLIGLGSAAVDVTGGRLGETVAADVLVAADGAETVLESPRLETVNVRGSGCTLAAAITAGLARGHEVAEAVAAAKAFVAARLADAAGWRFDGRGPVAHTFGDQGTSAHSSP